MKNFLRETFTAPGLVAIGLLIGGGMLFLWFLWAIEQAQADEVPVRAVTAAQHDRCMNLPRGSQEMEEERYGCFKKLYRQGRWSRTDR